MVELAAQAAHLALELGDAFVLRLDFLLERADARLIPIAFTALIAKAYDPAAGSRPVHDRADALSSDETNSSSRSAGLGSLRGCTSPWHSRL